jgi:KUP system potassium uptake protein
VPIFIGFVHVNVTNEPYGLNYEVDSVVESDIYFIEFNLSFEKNRVSIFYFRQVVAEMIQNKSGCF